MTGQPSTILHSLFGAQAAAFSPASLPTKHVFAQDGLERLPEVMRTGPLSSVARLASIYQGQVQMAGGVGAGFRQLPVQGPTPKQLLRMGLTAYFFDVLPSAPAVGPWLGQLAFELGIPQKAVRCAGWASPDGEGVRPHFDKYDGIILQLEGEKLYRIGPNRDFEHTVRQWSAGISLDLLDTVLFKDGVRPDSEPDDLEEVLLTPGSALFLPRGYWHGTKARGVSYSLSIRFDPPTIADLVIEQLRLTLLRDPSWRRPVYGAWGDKEGQAAACAFIEQQLQTLPEALTRLSARSALTRTADASDQFKHLGPESRLCRDTTVEIGLRTEPLSAILNDTWRLSTSVLKLPPSTGPLVEWVATTNGFFAIGEVEERFSDIGRKELWAALELLTRGGALKVVPFPA